MDLALIIGLVSGWIFIILSILLNADLQISGVLRFIDWPSVMVTVGGTIAATLVAFPMPVLLSGLKGFKNALKPSKVDPITAIKNIIDLANLARKEGILALEDAASAMDDDFLQKGIMLVVDGTDPELVRNILETEISFIEERHKKVSDVWEFIGTMGPSWGMIGTLIGLVMMLQSMSDPAAIGPAMAVAIITTFYGSVIANFIANPIANKLKVFSSEEQLVKEVLIEGILSIAAGENPRIIEEKLKVFLSPILRDTVGANDNTQVGEE